MKGQQNIKKKKKWKHVGVIM